MVDVEKNGHLSEKICLIPSCQETKYVNETTGHTLLKFTVPLVKIVLVFFKTASVWQVKASFKKGIQPQGSNKTKRVHRSIKDGC